MTNKVKLFLDDVRNPEDCVGYMYKRIGKLNPVYLEGWIVVRNYQEFVFAIEQYAGMITHVSFDHDLADEHYTALINNTDISNCKEKTGLDCAKFLKSYYQKLNLPLPVMFVHSMNPVGTENIVNLFKI